MSLIQQIPKDFYRVFRTKNMEHYFTILVELYKVNMEQYNTFGMTKNECKEIINETMVEQKIVWQEDIEEQDTDFEEGEQIPMRTPSARSLNNLLQWGWLREDYDEQINEYILTFPEYSQMFVELLWQLGMDSDSQERENIMSIYSLLYTYHTDKDHNNDILKNAWKTSRRLTQLLTNMQEGMRGYFDKLSDQRNFLGIQEILVQEINNNDSKKYAMLTTTDSFYRYKEQVKELVSDILNENEEQNLLLQEQWLQAEPETREALRAERKLKMNEETREYIIRIEREFDSIEKKYNALIEQKSVFAQRALARVQFILQEGMEENENVSSFVKMIGEREDGEEITACFRERQHFSMPFMQFTEKSLYQKRNALEKEFIPHAIKEEEEKEENLTEFVPQPLYSGKELREFREKNTIGGRFMVTGESIESIEDLEKLMLLWQQVTKDTEQSDESKISLGEKIEKQIGENQKVTFSRLVIEELEERNV
ncbi:MAG: hypothetical protein K2N51_12410 [Lachnospiraceae bacterium]|nr:hypothetical protein [Lachnospiraceae bacterium]